MAQFVGVLKDALMITSFVFSMMLVIEYLNVLTRGEWQNRLGDSRWGQYLLAALLGATPGCLGAFVVVALYSHRAVSLGAVVAAMVATSGDEAFVMLALIPTEALFLFGGLFVIGVLAGAATDFVFRRRQGFESGTVLELHDRKDCRCYPRGDILRQWKEMSIARGTLSLVLLLLLSALVMGELGPPSWDWKRITFLFVSAVGLFIVATVPEHFLEEHLWGHVAKKHLPQIFLWTFGALLVVHVISSGLQIDGLIRDHHGIMLLAALLIGIIPSSGPHLVFVTLFAEGVIPLSVLGASSLVQDGHGMIPLLAFSRKDFVLVKLINILIGAVLGSIGLALGW